MFMLKILGSGYQSEELDWKLLGKYPDLRIHFRCVFGNNLKFVLFNTD